MMKIPQKHARNALIFNERLKQAKINRIKLGIDKTMLSDTRLTKALTEEPLFEQAMQLIERKPRKEDKI